MTISSENNRNDYVGNGAVDTYSYTFKIFAEVDLQVTTRDTSNIETVLVLNTDFTVTGVGASGGGTIVLSAGNLTTDYVLTIRRNRALTQDTDIRNEGDFYPETIEDALDDQTMKTQTLKFLLDKTMNLPDTVSGVSTTLPVPVADKVLKWNAAADGIEAVDAGAIGVTTFTGGLEKTGSDLHVQDGGITSAKLANNLVVAGTLGITGATTLTGGVTGDVNASGALIGATATIGGKSPLLLTAPDGSAIAGPGRAGTLAVTDQAYRRRLNANGAFLVDQVNDGAAVTVNASAGVYGPDMIVAYGQATDGVFTLQRLSTGTPPPNAPYYIQTKTTTADASIGAAQQYWVAIATIEGYDFAHLGWGTATAKDIVVSFPIRASQTGTFGFNAYVPTGTRSYPFTHTIASADTWETATVVIPGDTTNAPDTTTGTAIRIYADLGSGSNYKGTSGAWATANLRGVTGATDLIATLNATLDIGPVQIEESVSGVATPFEWRGYDEELRKCQRYYHELITVSGQAWESGYMSAGTGRFVWLDFPVQMRTAPTCTVVGTWAFVNTAALGFNTPTIYGVATYVTHTAAGTAYAYRDSADDKLTFDSRL